MSNIADIRQDYRMQTLSEHAVETDPILQFGRWWDEALESKITEVNAFTLATATPAGHPSARIVLLKGFDADGFVFFTNYDSNKGHQLAANPAVSMVFFWKELERQVRIEGTAEKVTEAESDAYFFSRPVGSRIGAWASPQSQVIPGRALLEENVRQLESLYQDGAIPRPEHWGGYRIKPSVVEFWQGRQSRLHDRIRYRRIEENWHRERLAP